MPAKYRKWTTRLSTRELDILIDLANGYTREAIGRLHGIKLSTVKSHIEVMKLKLGAINIPHLVWLSRKELDAYTRRAGQAGQEGSGLPSDPEGAIYLDPSVH